MNCKTIAFAGGAGCGKSSVHSLLKTYPVNPNYRIIFLDEVATEFLNDMPHSISAKNTPTVLQYYILRTQLMLEKLAKNEAQKCERNSVILLDRGLTDIHVYLDEKEIAEIITPEQEKELDMRYDCIMFFDATGILSENNPARVEKTLEELNKISLRTKKAWSAHSKKMISIPPAKTIEEKAKYTAMLINRFVADEVFIIPDNVIE